MLAALIQEFVSSRWRNLLLRYFKGFTRLCIADQVANNVGSIEPSLWVISGQKFDGAEPVLLILPVRLQIILAFRSQDRQISQSFQTPYAKTRGTRTVQPKPAPWRF